MGRVFFFEFRRQLNNRYYWILLFLLSFLISFVVKNGRNEFLAYQDQVNSFKKLEEEKVKNYINYTQYGIYGFRVLQVPGTSLNVLFNRSAPNHMTEAFIDSAVRLKFHTPRIGPTLFYRTFGGNLDLGWIVLILGSIGSLLFGYFLPGESIMSLFVRIEGFYRVHFAIFFARILLISITFILSWIVAFIYIYTNNYYSLDVNMSFLFQFLVVGNIYLFFFYSVGVFFRFVSRNKIMSLSLIVGFWIFSLHIVPEFLNQKIYMTNSEDIYKHEMDKLSVLMKFEREALNTLRRFPNLKREEIKRKEAVFAEHYWDNEFKRVEILEGYILEDSQKKVDSYLNMSAFFPPAFLKSVSIEISGNGFQSYTGFFEYCSRLRAHFIRFYIDRKYHSNYTKVKRFQCENVFESLSRKHPYFNLGMFVSLLYITGFSLLGALFHKRRYHYVPGSVFYSLKPDPGCNATFLYFADLKTKQNAVNYFKTQYGVIVLEKINPKDFNLIGVNYSTYRNLFTGLCYSENFLQLADKMDIFRNKEELSDESLLSLVLVVLSSLNPRALVVNGFLSNVSVELEKKAMELLNDLSKDVYIVFLSCNMFSTVFARRESEKNSRDGNSQRIGVDISSISIR